MLAWGMGVQLTGLPAGARRYRFVAGNLPAADYLVFTDAALTLPATVYNAGGDILAQPLNATGGVEFWSDSAEVHVSSVVQGGGGDPPGNITNVKRASLPGKLQGVKRG